MGAFEFNIDLPADRSFATMIRDLVAHGAREAGSAEDAAVTFGCTVEEAVREMLATAAGERLAIVVRKQDGPVEVVISSRRATRTLALDV